MTNYILAYYQKIKDGSETVGKWVALLYELIIDRIQDGAYIFDNQKANRAIKFIETFCRHNKGRLAPGPLKLDLWEKAFISCLYGIVDDKGKRQFKEVALFVGRKCGKTLLAAAIIAYEAYVDGEFGSEIYCIAPKLDQSELVFSAFEFTKDKNPDLLKRTRKRKYDYIIDSTNTVIKKIAFSEKRADGYSPMLTVADEMSSWPAARGLKQYEVMTSGTGARVEPITLSISSGGYVEDGIYDELFKRGTRFLMGESEEKKLLPIFYTIDDVDKWDDINELRKSLPGLGVSVSVQFILDEIDIARNSLSKKTEFLTKYCNIKQNSSQAWLSTQDITLCMGDALKLEDFRKSYCVGGIDLSMTTDLTSCCVLIEKDRELYVFSKFFLPAEKIEEATERDQIPYRAYIERGFLQISGEHFVDYNDCFMWFKELVEKYDILPLQVGYDRYNSQYLIQDMAAYGFHMDDVYQGTNLTPVLREMEGHIKEGHVHIGDNDLLKIHFLNSAIKLDTDNNKIRLVKLSPSAHIDGMAALSDAFCVRQKWFNDIGHQLMNKR
jgi:phage terminase large subunit-like protein